MRADMKKVLTERPRAHSRYAYNDVRRKQNAGDYDLMPHCQGMRQPYGYDTKEFSDLLGPLRNYMRSCVGRRWDDVYSEICQAVGSGNTVDQHLRDHVMREIETHAWIDADGDMCCYHHYTTGAHHVEGLYVDPRDGLIYYNERPSYRSRHGRPVMVDGLAYTRRDDGVLIPRAGWGRMGTPHYPLKIIGDQRAVWIDGVWYWVTLCDVPPAISVPYIADGVTRYRTVTFPRYDFVLGKNVTEGRYHAEKRQMSSRDLRRHDLRN